MVASEKSVQKMTGAALLLAALFLCASAVTPLPVYSGGQKSISIQTPREKERLSESDEDESEAIQERIRLYRRRHGVIPSVDRLRITRDEYEKQKARDARAAQPEVEPTWVSLGPTNGAGRMTAIAPHPTAMGTAYVGADGGGVWKTVNGGASWVSLTDSINNLNVGALGLAPSSPTTIYVGTGSEHASGIGMLKSTDGGATWLFPASVVATRFFRISVHPTNPQELVAATDQGGFRSTDGGSVWTSVIPSFTVTDVVRDATNPQVLYAARYGCPTPNCNGSILKSTDAGATWAEKNVGLPVDQSVSYIALAISSSNPLVLYASFSIGGIAHICKTVNGADSWINLGSVSSDPGVNNYMGFQAFHDNTIVVSPTDSNLVIAAGIHYVRSTDGGTTWEFGPYQNEFPHVDATDLRYQGSTLYTANDGGIWSIPNNGLGSVSTSRNNGLLTREYYAMANDEVNRNRIFAGAQDNGTDRRPDAGGTSWLQVFGGDGFDCAVNPNVPSVAYWTYQGGIVFRTKDAANVSTSVFSGATEPFYPADEGGGFGTILTMDNSNPSTLYTATYRVWRTTNGGDTWAPLPTTTTDGSIWCSVVGPDIGVVAIAPSDSSVLMVTKYDPVTGQVVFRSSNGGNSWTRGSPNPGLFINLEIDRANPNIAFAAALDFSGNSVYMTTNGGATWVPRASGLPTLPAQAVRIDPNNSNVLYCGTDAGVYRSTDQGLNWTRYGLGLPSVSVDDLRIIGDGSIVRVATYGRGVWEIQFPTANTPPNATITSPASTLRVIKGTQVTFQGSISDPDAGDSATGTWTFTDTGETVSVGSGASSPSHTFLRAGSFPVALTARDTHAARGSASVVINVFEPFDSCDTPAIIPGSGPFPYVFTASDEATTIQVSDPTSCSGAASTLWFEFTPTVTGTYRFFIDRRIFNISTNISIWTGPKCGPYTAVPGGCQFDDLTVSAQAGNTLRIMLDALNASWGRTFALVVSTAGGGCPYALSSANQTFTPSGGSSTVDVTAADGCNWTASSNVNWITFQSGESGAGDGSVNYIVAPNLDAARTGSMTIAGQTFRVNQTGTCAANISAFSATASAFSATGSIGVTAPAGCAWSSSSDVPWLSIMSGDTGVGNGTIVYVVDSNLNVSPRVGAISAAGQVFTVNQAGIAAIGLNSVRTDFDSDGKTDIGFYRGGLWGFLKSAQSYSLASAQFFSWGGSGLQPISADFDGDGKADIAYMVPPAGGQSAAYAILQSTRGYSFLPGDVLYAPAGFPVLGDTPVAADFDGDGKADPGIWRASQGIWIIPKTSTNYTGYIFSQWGRLGDVPVVADFDMDGKADIGFYRDGLWGVLKSGQNFSLGSAQFFSWGGAGLQPIAGDFDGDGKADIGYIVPPSGGQSAAYSILQSSTGYSFLPGDVLFVPAGFPVLGDTPVIGRFDGDAKDDPGIWRESQGVWILPRSSTNYTTFTFSQWGQAGDIPFPNTSGKH